MKALIFVLLIACTLPAQSRALQLLDSAKSMYGSPVEVGVPSPIIDTLRAYAAEYAVKDFLNQYDKLHAQLAAVKVAKSWGSWVVDMSNLYGRERNFPNAFYAYFGASSGFAYDLAWYLCTVKANPGKLAYYADKFTMPDKDVGYTILFDVYGVSPWYTAVYLKK